MPKIHMTVGVADEEADVAIESLKAQFNAPGVVELLEIQKDGIHITIHDSIYILTVTHRGTGRIVHQEVFSDRPTFPAEETGYSNENYNIQFTQASINGGDHSRLTT